MSKDLPANIILEKNKTATASAWLVLLEITLTDDTIFRLVRNNENITFGGNVYTAFNFELDAYAQDISGKIPSVMLRVSNITLLLESYIRDLDGGIGSSIKITVVNSEYLSEDYSELEMEFDVLGCTTDSKWVVFTLGAPNPLLQRFPLRRYIGLHCGWTFKSAECGYSGVATTCERTLNNCRSLSNSERFGGFPAMRSGCLRVVG